MGITFFFEPAIFFVGIYIEGEANNEGVPYAVHEGRGGGERRKHPSLEDSIAYKSKKKLGGEKEKK
jgi:hypothetical protein